VLRISGRAVSLAILLVACLFVLPSHAVEVDKVPGTLSVRDALTSPGKPVRLEARLVRAGMLGPTGLGGERIEFTVDGRSAGAAMTGGDGRAFLDYTPRMRGNQPIAVKLFPNKRVESPEARGTLFSWERRRPILLVEMASLIEAPKTPTLPIPSLPLEVRPGASRSPVPDAAQELKRLTAYFYNVVYIAWSGRLETGDQEDVRDWLRRHHFPPGLAVPLTAGASALTAKLDDLKAEGWDNLKAGIGRSREFAEVLAERRVEAIIMPSSERDEQGLPRKAQVIKDWKEVRKKLQG
jgi:hypothetical protein